MAETTLKGGHKSGLAATLRTDNWWFEAVWTGIGFLCFVVYATWAAIQGNHYFHENYLSPFYSPVLFTDLSIVGAAPLGHAWFGFDVVLAGPQTADFYNPKVVRSAAGALWDVVGYCPR